ncbi:MAG TPA: hypothetical protein VH593_08700 [Ktedonobacteraceae bacterium]
MDHRESFKLDGQTRRVIWHVSTADKQNNTPFDVGAPLIVGNTVIVYLADGLELFQWYSALAEAVRP